MGSRLRKILVGAAVLVLCLPLAGVAYEQVGRRNAIALFPPPGRLIDVDGRDAHLHCLGTGSPALILESGLDTGGTLAWTPVHEELAKTTRACAYDRAGIMWSEPGAEPRDADNVVTELHALLEAAGEAPPYILVGHSLGGLFARAYTDRFPEEVAGIVFVDSSHPEQVERFPLAVREQIAVNQASQPSRARFRLAVATGFYRLTGPSPIDARRAFLWRTLPNGFMGEQEAANVAREQVGATGDLGDRPIVVLSAGIGPRMPALSDAENDAFYQSWLELQAELAALSTNSVHEVVEGATHYIQADAPESVIAATRDVVEAVRTSKRLDEPR